MRRQGNAAQTIEEGLREVGIDPDRAMGEFRRTANLVEARTRGYQGRIERDTSGIEESAPGQIDEAAFKIIKKLFRTAGEKVKEKLGRKKRGLAKLARQSRMYRKKNKRKIAKRQKKKLAKFGAKGLARLHKMRKRITMSAPAGSSLASLRESLSGSSSIAQLREDLATVGNEAKSGNYNPYEEAAFNAGLLAYYLGEVFDVSGDTASAEAMFQVSDAAADLSQALDGLGEDDTLGEAQEQKLVAILESIQKGLRLHEEMGQPLVSQAMDFRLKHDADSFFEECSDDDDGDDEEDDEDEDEDEDEDDDEE